MASILPVSPVSSQDSNLPYTPKSESDPNNIVILKQDSLGNTGYGPVVAVNNPAAAAAAKRKSSRRANTAERRATHNAVERQRRETLNGRFLDLAALLPSLSTLRRPSKSSIVNASIAFVNAARRHRSLAAKELRNAQLEIDQLRRENNEWRARDGLPQIQEPLRSESWDRVLRGEMEIGPVEGLLGEEDEEDNDDDNDGLPPIVASNNHNASNANNAAAAAAHAHAQQTAAAAAHAAAIAAAAAAAAHHQHNNPYHHPITPAGFGGYGPSPPSTASSVVPSPYDHPHHHPAASAGFFDLHPSSYPPAPPAPGRFYDNMYAPHHYGPPPPHQYHPHQHQQHGHPITPTTSIASTPPIGVFTPPATAIAGAGASGPGQSHFFASPEHTMNPVMGRQRSESNASSNAPSSSVYGSPPADATMHQHHQQQQQQQPASIPIPQSHKRGLSINTDLGGSSAASSAAAFNPASWDELAMQQPHRGVSAMSVLSPGAAGSATPNPVPGAGSLGSGVMYMMF